MFDQSQINLTIEKQKQNSSQDKNRLKSSTNLNEIVLSQNFLNLDEKNIDVAIEQIMINSGQNTNLKISLKNRNPFLKMNAPDHLLSPHVFNFYNIGAINEFALKNPNKDEESYIRTLFYIYSVERVETRKNAIILYLKVNQTKPNVPIWYVIDRFKSFGDQIYNQMANKMTDLVFFMQKMQEINKQRAKIKQDPPSAIIDFMGDRLYICKYATNKLIFSRTLLELLGYEPEMFALRATKYKSVLEEFLSSENYQQLALKFLDNAKWMRCLIEQKITLSAFGQLTAYEFSDYLLGKDNKKIFCKIKLFFPDPTSGCLEVLQIISETEKYIQSSSSSMNFNKKIIKTQSEKIQRNQFKILEKIIKLPKNMQVKSEAKVAGYKIMEQKDLI